MKIIDCGKASKVARGFVFAFFFELGIPPANKTMFPC